MKITQMFIDRWINTQNVVYACNEILFSHEKEGSHAISISMDEPGGHYAKQNKPDRGRKILLLSPWYVAFKQVKLTSQNRVEGWSPRAEVAENEESFVKGHQLPAGRVSSEEPTYHVVIMVNATMLHTWNLPGLWIFFLIFIVIQLQLWILRVLPAYTHRMVPI